MSSEEETRAVLAFNPTRRQSPPATEAGADSSAANPTASSGSAALQRVYDAHAVQIYRFIYHKVGNREDAEDLTAQVFVKATQSLDANQDEQSQIAWLYQVARTTIADHWRVYYKGSVVSLDAMEEEFGHQEVLESPAFAAPVPETADPAVHKVQAILGQLPENYRQVLTLRFLQGYSLKETAAAMNISEGNVKVLQYRALQKASNMSPQRGGA
jgi:RNA polymerase sigma-70 factor, ECF subfamily